MKSMVVVYRAWGEMEAGIIKGLLESNGIICMTESVASPSVHVFNIDGMGETRILVNEADADMATRLIEEEAVQNTEEQSDINESDKK